MQRSHLNGRQSLKGIAIIGVPSSAGARKAGQEQAPAHLRRQGFLKRLADENLEVVDLGDTSMVSFVQDTEHPKAQNIKLVAEVARETARKVLLAGACKAMPIVIGGDCTITLGILSGLRKFQNRLGLLYFDGDVDLNTPDTTHTGILDGMALAHIIGKGDQSLSGLGGSNPLVPEDRIVVFGYNPGSGWIDPEELSILEGSEMKRYPTTLIRGTIQDHALEACSYLEEMSGRFLIHFDIDVIDARSLSLADVPHENGLPLRDAMEALKVFIASPYCSGLVLTEINPSFDREGTETRKLLDALLPVLASLTS